MMLYLILFSIIGQPLVCKGSVTLPTITKEINSKLPLSAAAPSDDSNKLAFEGGGTLPDISSNLALSKDKQLSNLLELDAEFNKTKKQPVTARKGVDNPINKVPKNTSEMISTVTQKTDILKDPPIAISKVNNSKTLVVSEAISTTKVPKKPLLLSYEALINADKNNQIDETKIPATNPSSKTLPSSKDQIPSPNEDAIVKIYPAKANSHPGMIMPIVITILVVPMFAIVGYMALKRGKEAWKNRHYKRMDFLLDGMYND